MWQLTLRETTVVDVIDAFSIHSFIHLFCIMFGEQTNGFELFAFYDTLEQMSLPASILPTNINNYGKIEFGSKVCVCVRMRF